MPLAPLSMASQSSVLPVPVIQTIYHGRTSCGEEVFRYNLSLSDKSCELSFISYGACLTSCKLPDREGRVEECTLNYGNLQDIEAGEAYYGALCGRVCNRIARGKFEVDGVVHQVPVNNGPNSLHGGQKGFDKRVFGHREVREEEALLCINDCSSAASARGVCFSYESHDGEEGYPGTVNVEVSYLLTSERELVTKFAATVDGRATPINLTNHAYWNLSGELKETVASHHLHLSSSGYLPIDNDQIPTGEIKDVKGTLFDLRAVDGVKLEDVLNEVGGEGGGKLGFDHCMVIDRVDDDHEGELMPLVGRLWHEKSGRIMTLHATQPGVQLYTANWLGGEHPHIPHNAVCLETQQFPNAINSKDPSIRASVLIQPGQTYSHTAKHTFGITAEQQLARRDQVPVPERPAPIK
ncbi:unnamed protein product [Chrysoparadoxa australica]